MRKYNFYPGPSTIPKEVLDRYKKELYEFEDSGASFMELSHRSSIVLDAYKRITNKIKDLFGVGDDYHVLLLPGGAIGMTAAIPMNLLRGHKRVAYAVTGHWGKLAFDQAKKYCEAVSCCDTTTAETGCTIIPDPQTWQIPDDCAYVHYTDNETIHGVEYPAPPKLEGQLLVVDQSSSIFSRPYDVSNIGLVYACLQKNLGPSGLAVVVVRKDLCGQALPITPNIWDFALQASHDSMVNTIPTLQVRMLELMLDWIVDRGGLTAIGETNKSKAAKLYNFIDENDFYSNNIDPNCRSSMNVPFILANPELDGKFVTEAGKRGLIGLRGHRVVGGMRASIYNSMPVGGVDSLVEFMHDFATVNG